MINILKDKRVIVGGIILLLTISIVGYWYFDFYEEKNEIDEGISVIEKTTKVVSNNFYVDVKGGSKLVTQDYIN